MNPEVSWLKAPGRAKLAMKSARTNADERLDRVEAPRHHFDVERRHQREHQREQDEERPQQARGRNPRRAHHHQFAVAIELVQAVEHADEQRHRRDDRHQRRRRQPREAEKDEQRLALVGEQIDLPQRLGDPNDAGQRRQTRQKRVSGGAENVSFDSQHPAIEFRWPTGECRRSAGGSAALARRRRRLARREGPHGRAAGAALLTAARNPTMKAAVQPPYTRGAACPNSSRSPLARSPPQGRNLCHLRRRGSQAFAAGRGADRRGGGAPRIGGQGGPLPRQGLDRDGSRRSAGAGRRAAPDRRRRAGQGRQADRFRQSRRLRLRQARRREEGRGRVRRARGRMGGRSGRRVRAGPAAARLPLRPLQDQEGQRRRGRRRRRGGDDRVRRRRRRARRRRPRWRSPRASSSPARWSTSRQTSSIPNPSPSARRG